MSSIFNAVAFHSPLILLTTDLTRMKTIVFFVFRQNGNNSDSVILVLNAMSALLPRWQAVSRSRWLTLVFSSQSPGYILYNTDFISVPITKFFQLTTVLTEASIRNTQNYPPNFAYRVYSPNAEYYNCTSLILQLICEPDLKYQKPPVQFKSPIHYD